MKPKVYSVSEHDIEPSLVDPDALYVLEKLKDAGFIAYLVGGSVRDLLLKRTPKDFDISTSALPEEIKQLFHRQCLLIGRRFRLAHIRIGHKIIEVSTFRSGENEDDLILRDNEWGTPEQDVLRRDFTINGLFYDPSTHTIIDYVGGWEDIHSNLLRTIGVPETRFRQDPVRMIRLLKFRARFGFEITPESRKALFQCKNEMLKSSPARILEELLRMLESSSAAPFFKLLFESEILELLNPSLADFFKRTSGNEIYRFLASADQVNLSSGKTPLSRPILIACLLFPLLNEEIAKKSKENTPKIAEILMTVNAVINEFEKRAFVRFPRRIIAITSSILAMQYRLTPLSGKTHHHTRIFRQKDFNDALILLKVRAIENKSLIESYTEWKTFYRQHLKQTERKGHQHRSMVKK